MENDLSKEIEALRLSICDRWIELAHGAIFKDVCDLTNEEMFALGWAAGAGVVLGQDGMWSLNHAVAFANVDGRIQVRLRPE